MADKDPQAAGADRNLLFGILALQMDFISKRLASASSDGTVKVWDADTGREVLTLRGHRDRHVCSVVFSPDGTQLASASYDQTVKIGDAASGREVLTFLAGKRQANIVAIPLHPQLAEILKSLPDKIGHLFPFRHVPQEVSRRFAKNAKQAGLRISLHDMRRSFGSRYASVVPALVLQRLMRHADIKTMLAFYTDVDDVLDQAILKA